MVFTLFQLELLQKKFVWGFCSFFQLKRVGFLQLCSRLFNHSKHFPAQATLTQCYSTLTY